MKRNTEGPYLTGDIGYDKDYNYDYNLRITEPPGYPARTDEEGQISLSIQSYGQIE